MDIDTEIAAYFINNTTVDSPYALTEAEQAELQRKLTVFDTLTENFPISIAKQASKLERQAMNQMKEPSLTYGEIEFFSFGEIFYTIKNRYQGFPEGGIFYDLGSGTGKAIIAAALLGNFSECRGVEILSSLYEISEKVIAEYNDKFTKYVLTNSDLWTVIPRLRSMKGDILQTDFSDADGIFVNSTCFSDEMVNEISEKEVKVGTIAISLTKPLSANKWAQLEIARKKMSWGEATIYIQRRIDPEKQRELMLEFGRALDSS